MGVFERPDRPSVSLKLAPLEIVVEIAALAGIVVNLVLFLYFWPKLPDVAAPVNRAGMAVFVTLLPMLVYLGATIVGLFPRWFNYPVPITIENAAREYRLAGNMLRLVKAEVVLCMLDIEWVFINISTGEDMTLTPVFVVVFLGLLAITILYFVYEMYRQK